MKKILLLIFFFTQSKTFCQLDKAAHFFCGSVISIVTGKITFEISPFGGEQKRGLHSNNIKISFVSGFVIGSGTGYLKERIYDGYLHNGFESKKDFQYTALGSLTGSVILIFFLPWGRTQEGAKRHKLKKNENRINPSGRCNGLRGTNNLRHHPCLG